MTYFLASNEVDDKLNALTIIETRAMTGDEMIACLNWLVNQYSGKYVYFPFGLIHAASNLKLPLTIGLDMDNKECLIAFRLRWC